MLLKFKSNDEMKCIQHKLSAIHSGALTRYIEYVYFNNSKL